MRVTHDTNAKNGKTAVAIFTDTGNVYVSERPEAVYTQVTTTHVTRVEASTCTISDGGEAVTLDMTTETGHISVTLHGKGILDKLAAVICGEQWVAGQTEADEVLA